MKKKMTNQEIVDAAQRVVANVMSDYVQKRQRKGPKLYEDYESAVDLKLQKLRSEHPRYKITSTMNSHEKDKLVSLLTVVDEKGKKREFDVTAHKETHWPSDDFK